MRNTRSSGNTSCTSALSAWALWRSTPKGFSSTTRERSARPGLPSVVTISPKAPGGIDEVVQPPRLAAQPPLRALHRRLQRPGLVGAEGAKDSRSANRSHVSLAAVADGGARERAEVLVGAAACARCR